VSKEIWQKAALLSYHPLSAANVFVRSGLPTNTWFLGPTSVSPKWHIGRFSRFCTAHMCAQHTDTQITLCATSVAIGHKGDAA